MGVKAGLVALATAQGIAFPSAATVYSCHPLEMYELSNGAIRPKAEEVRSYWLDFYREIIFDDETGVAIFNLGGKRESLSMEVIQRGSKSNSAIAFFSGTCFVSCARHYLRIDSYKEGSPFMIDYLGTILAGDCE